MKSRISIVISVMVIGIGLYGVSQNISTNTQQADSTVVAEREEVFTFYELLEPVSQGEALEYSDFKIVTLKQTEANEKGFSESEKIKLAPGSVSRKTLKSGVLVRQTDISNPDDEDYVRIAVKTGSIPYPLEVANSAVQGGVISVGSFVDVLAMSTESGPGPLAGGNHSSNALKTASISDVLRNIKVLKVEKGTNEVENRSKSSESKSVVVLELTKQQATEIALAEVISHLFIQASSPYGDEVIYADSGDVVKNFKAIKEYRAARTEVN
ncbi:Flp pilus assembly protein CpaB [Vibrio sp. SCSIO 43135]|uniref:Flp pilus assembly protein CpaB n=1 Tax=Vibrio sp. SCSIO 43135 TaxID=2819096 RepID=UPI002076458B|nr:Flp pilus assembly protein CpaB [Vibrio sp. SCSIO 43135]USD40106.1 Flp pilus assembly protein CpaB [Vibrio sp. SCSIO 43135]